MAVVDGRWLLKMTLFCTFPEVLFVKLVMIYLQEEVEVAQYLSPFFLTSVGDMVSFAVLSSKGIV